MHADFFSMHYHGSKEIHPPVVRIDKVFDKLEAVPWEAGMSEAARLSRNKGDSCVMETPRPFPQSEFSVESSLAVRKCQMCEDADNHHLMCQYL